jgi:hypothetical protein
MLTKEKLITEIAEIEARVQNVTRTMDGFGELADHVRTSEATVKKAHRAIATIQSVINEQHLTMRRLQRQLVRVCGPWGGRNVIG